MCQGINISVKQVSGSRNFVTQAEVRRLLNEWKLDNTNMPVSHINLQRIEDKLNSIDNIEHATVSRLANNKVQIDVTPMIPVARVFSRGKSFYINRDGKRLTANARFHIDVPVITGNFDDDSDSTGLHNPKRLLPLIERLRNDSTWNALVAQISVDPRTNDIILVPMIRGHVINLGDTSNINNKLQRIITMYHDVLPLKGWTYYDTLSVKWGGQVVASRRLKSIPEPLIRFDREGESTDDDISVDNMMVADTVGIAPSKH